MTLNQKAYMPDTVWTIEEATAKLTELIEEAQVAGPQKITRDGSVVAVVVSHDAWARRERRSGSLAEFFARSPLCGSGLDLERDEDGARSVDL